MKKFFQKVVGDFENTAILAVYLVVGIALVGVVALMSNIFSLHDMQYQTLAVVLSVIVTAIVTSQLLNGQSNKEEAREKNSKVFERKLIVYEQFLDMVRRVIEDGEITKKEANELEFALSNMAIHTNSKDILKVIDSVRIIIQNAGSATESAEQKEKGGGEITEAIPSALVEIVSILKKDLYQEEIENADKEEFKDKFQDILKIFEEQFENDVPKVHEKMVESLLKIRDGVLKEMGDGWHGEVINSAEGSQMPLGLAFDKGNRNDLVFYLACDPNYYLQLHIGGIEDRYRDVYWPFKSRFGGRINKYSWWKWLLEKYKGRDVFLNCLEKGDPAFIEEIQTEVLSVLKYLEETNN